VSPERRSGDRELDDTMAPTTTAHINKAARRPTLRDVAAAAGVDASLVSRVVNHDPSITIPRSTRQRIERAVAELRYQPNVRARGLRMARAFTVGFILPKLSSPVYGPIVEGLQQRATRDGYVVMLGGLGDGERPEASFARLLGEGRVDGLLLGSADTADSTLLRLLKEPQPIVLVNRAVEGSGVSCATVDDASGARTAVQHLLDLGHRQIGVIAGPPGLDTTKRRLRGAKDAVRRRSLAVVTAAALDAPSGEKAMSELLSRHPTVTAVFASNVEIAVGALATARATGLAVPADLSVITLHDHPLAPYVQPALTTVTLPLAELGRVAFELLLRRIDGEKPVSVVVDGPTQLIQRASTAPPRSR